MNKAEIRQHNMTNSHIVFQEFDYYEPHSLAEAVLLANKYGNTARILAGGTQLLTQMKMERDHVEKIINISNIPSLDEIVQNEKGELIIGSLVKIKTIASHPYINANYTALAQSCSSFGSTQIEVMATIGGNLCTGSPASDTVPPLLIHNAQLIIQGPSGERRIPVDGFILSPGKTALKQGEILTHLVLPAPVPGSLSLYFKITRVVADLAKASMAAYLVRDGNKILDFRVAYGSVAPTPIRIPAVESALKDKVFLANLSPEAGNIAEKSIFPIDDVRSSANYRRRIVNVMTRDAVEQLWERSQKSSLSPEFKVINSLISQSTTSAPNIEVSKVNQRKIVLTINGKKHHLSVKPNDLLLNVLRENLQLTGTKYGCGVGECSACTILLNNNPVLSCLLLAITVDGQEITTIEGLMKPDGSLDPLQESFIENGAFQCGYCTPGIIMTLKGLLAESKKPGEAEIRDYLKGNRCRCTGYSSIVRAVMATFEEGDPHAK